MAKNGKIHDIGEPTQPLADEIKKLKMELITIILGYESELAACKRSEISEFSNGCMERYFQLSKEVKGE